MANAGTPPAVREIAPWIEVTARIGYVSIGVVYVIAGSMTAAAAAGMGGRTTSWRDAITTIGRAPLGGIALVVLGIGLIGYSAWRVINGILDSDHRGSDAKGWAVRARSIATGAVHLAMAYAVLQFAFTHHHNNAGGNSQAKVWTARVMDVAGGRWLVGVAGLILMAVAIAALWHAWDAELGKRLHLERAPAPGVFLGVARFGIAARGVVAGVIGGSLLTAAIRHDPSRTEATKGALQNIAHVPWGRPLLVMVSLGLAAYGLYQFLKARYRTVEAD